jgi:hypothetical protein
VRASRSIGTQRTASHALVACVSRRDNRNWLSGQCASGLAVLPPNGCHNTYVIVYNSAPFNPFEECLCVFHK